jgi:HEAT repeat protein
VICRRRLSGADAGEALIGALSDRNWHVRRRVVQALGRAWSDRAAEPLAELLTEERSERVRRVAAYALGRMEGDAALEALESLRDDLDPYVRRIATIALD